MASLPILLCVCVTFILILRAGEALGITLLQQETCYIINSLNTCCGQKEPSNAHKLLNIDPVFFRFPVQNTKGHLNGVSERRVGALPKGPVNFWIVSPLAWNQGASIGIGDPDLALPTLAGTAPSQTKCSRAHCMDAGCQSAPSLLLNRLQEKYQAIEASINNFISKWNDEHEIAAIKLAAT